MFKPKSPILRLVNSRSLRILKTSSMSGVKQGLGSRDRLVLWSINMLIALVVVAEAPGGPDAPETEDSKRPPRLASSVLVLPGPMLSSKTAGSNATACGGSISKSSCGVASATSNKPVEVDAEDVALGVVEVEGDPGLDNCESSASSSWVSFGVTSATFTGLVEADAEDGALGGGDGEELGLKRCEGSTKSSWT